MDNFIETYLVFMTIGMIIFVTFWGLVIFIVVRFLAGDSGMSTSNKLSIIGYLMKIFGGRGGGSDIGPNESAARGILTGEGIDPDR
jgi:hypothetical protein